MFPTLQLPGTQALTLCLRVAQADPSGISLLSPLVTACTFVRQNPYVVSVQELALPHKAQRAFEKGNTLLLKGDLQGSVPYFRQAIDAAPSFYRPYHNLALALSRLGQLDQAAENFQKSIDLSKGAFAPSLFGLSMILYRRSHFLHAETVIRSGLVADPASSVGEYCLALVQYSLGRFDDSESSGFNALRRNPNQADAYVLLARLHESRQNPVAVLADV